MIRYDNLVNTSKNRLRLTITLRKDLLPYLDQTIDGNKIRNRSHAIEYILGKHLGPKIKQAVILAGGEGTKMRPLTYEMPKAMIPIKRKPLLEYIVDSLKEFNIKDITIFIGNLGEIIKEYFGDGGKFGVKISYIQEKEKTGTGGALRQLKKYLPDVFLLIYGDVLAQINYFDLIEFHKSHQGLASIALTSLADPREFGVVSLHGSRIVGFEEKPEKDKTLSHLVSAGIYIFNSEITRYILDKGYVSLEKDVFPELAKRNKLFGYPFEGQWFDVSTPEAYERALREWKR